MNSSVQLSQLCEQVKDLNSKFIVVTGGVCSSIGKGILVASLGVLLKNAGYTVSIIKWDPYLNVDPGTMSPLIHGEVFVTEDGAETDLDLGHYERLVGISVQKNSSVSSGQIYQEVLNQEREGLFLGKCIQLVPHAVDIAKRKLLEFALKQKSEFILLEIGGTVGDMESEIFLETVRQLKMDFGNEYLMHAHLSYVPVLSWTGEVKTKPTQHSIIELKRAGLIPDCLFLRADKEVDKQSIDKLSVMCGLKKDYIFQVLTAHPIFQVFIDLDKQDVGKKVQEYFNIPTIRYSNLSLWEQFINQISDSTQELKIGLIAKYVGSNDPYISVIEAIKSAAYSNNSKIQLLVIEAEALFHDIHNKETSDSWRKLRSLDGIIVPGGFDSRGVEGKIVAAQWARENNIPYLGLCLGMQVMIIEIARNLLLLKDANSTEFNQKTNHPVICMLEEQRAITSKGATMRLGSYLCAIKEGSKAHEAYKKTAVLERHRHRYEVNNCYKDQLAMAGVIFSGKSEEMDLVEISELQDHIFMVGVQFHPEFQSSPLNVHPLFKAFVQAVLRNKNNITMNSSRSTAMHDNTKYPM
jgi:CTP synthase